MANMKWMASLVAIAAFASSAAHADVILGSFNFNSNQFGDSLAQSDNGTFANANWLNVINASPGSPGFLTGANFNTGIANIGLGGNPVYTIGYNTPIVNGAGADLGIVTARFSADSVTLTISGRDQTFGPGAGQDSTEDRSYFYGGGGPFPASLFVTLVDLSDFGIAVGESVNSIQVTGAPELDLIRVAGLARESQVPEPGTLALLGVGLAGLGALRRRR